MATKEYKQQISEKLKDPVLRRNLGNFADAYLTSRQKAYENKDFPAIREKISQARGYVADNVLEVADRFEAEATKRGAIVYRAADADAANKYIVELAKARNVQSVVKSKSMASEEIHLNKALEEAGVKAVETDLGEWIIQLAGHRPSHMVMPAIHMSREQVAELFGKELNRDMPVDIKYMVQTARETLRSEFFDAKMGISGANIAIAETGSIALVTNEGNDRLATTLPPIHVVLVGYEKLVNNFTDAGPILEALPRSATGQTLTSYVSFITGTTPTIGNNDSEITKELHIVLLDNGRLKMAKDPVFKKAYNCVRCASCLNVCPVYQLVGGHVYGKIYAGGIGTVLTSFMNGLQEVDGLQELCIACGRCKEVCPGGVPITDMMVEIRDRLHTKRKLPLKARLIFDKLMSNRKVFHTMLRAASLASKPLTGGQPFLRHMPLYGLTSFRSLPAIASRPLRDRVETIDQKIKNLKGTVAYFSGCATDFAYPEIGEAVIKVMNHLGYMVVFPQEQTCCGTPPRYMGDLDTARNLAKTNIAAMESAGADFYLTACPTCAGSLKHDWLDVLKDEPQWKERAAKIADSVKEFTSFCYSQMEDKLAENIPGINDKKITYHDSCHLKRNLGIFEEPRKLIKGTGGMRLVEMSYPDRCCGCGGSFSLKFPELSAPILEKKIEDIQSTGADICATACPGCHMQIKGGLDKAGSTIKVLHMAEILAAALDKNNK